MKQAGTLELYSYWDRLRAGRPAPERAEVEPADFKAVLADTYIIETAPQGFDVFRLAGTRLCAIFCRELKGIAVEFLFTTPDQPLAIRTFQSVARESVVAVAGLHGVSARGRSASFELLALPLQGPDARVLGSLVSTDNPFWLGADPIRELSITSMRILDPARAPLFLKNRPEIRFPDAAIAMREAARRGPDGDRIAAPGNKADEIAGGRRPPFLRVIDGGRQGPEA